MEEESQPEPERLDVYDRIEIRERADVLTGLTHSASGGSTGRLDLQVRPISRPGELVETVPSVIATQHSGGGKAARFDGEVLAVGGSSPRRHRIADDAERIPPVLRLPLVGPFGSIEYFLNLGWGFHSNDARGATLRVDPASGEPARRVEPLVQARGAEVGFRTSAGSLRWRYFADIPLVEDGSRSGAPRLSPTLQRSTDWAVTSRCVSRSSTSSTPKRATSSTTAPHASPGSRRAASRASISTPWRDARGASRSRGGSRRQTASALDTLPTP